MMTYQKMFAEYNHTAGAGTDHENTMFIPLSRENAHNTFEQLFRYGVIPVVNENDTVSTYEMQSAIMIRFLRWWLPDRR